MQPFAVVVADVADPLASEASDALARRRFDVRSVDAPQLALLRVTVHEQHADIEGRRLDAVVFLPSPLTRFSVDFDAADRDFCDAEVRAVWLAIINMDSVATVTRWSPEEWTSLGEWAIWRRRLIEADVPVTPMSFGAVATEDASAERWLPFSSATTHSIPGKLARGSLAPAIARCGVGASAIWCCGEIVAGPDLEPVRRAAAVVAEHRIGLAAITLDDQHRVLACTSRPEIRIPAHAHRIGARIAERLHDDVSHR